MLGKLMKHEFRATAKIFVPLFAAAAALMGVTQIIFLVLRLVTERQGLQGFPDAHPFMMALMVLLAIVSVLAMLALMAVIAIVTVQRFYKNLLGDEGYLMFTLPATPAQQILSKLFVGLSWTLAGVAVCLLAGFLFVWSCFPATADIGSLAASFRIETGMEPVLALLLMALFMLFAFANTYLQFYLCIAIGGQWPQNRLLASAAAYLILNTVLQFVMFFAMVAGVLVFHFADAGFFGGLQALVEQSPSTFFYGMLGLGAALMTALNAAYFFVTRWLLGRRLNLA